MYVAREGETMKITDKKTLDDFMEAVHKAKDAVYLKSPHGDVFNLKSTLSEFVAIRELIGERGDELELFCASKLDEPLFFSFFHKHAEVL